MNRLLFPIAAALVLALPAQDKPSPFRFVPADSMMVLRCAAPAQWQQQFARTQVAKLLQGDTFGSLRKQFSEGLDAAMAELRQSGEFDADLVEQLLADYRGEMVLSMQLDLDGLMAAIAQEEVPDFSMVLALSPDGKHDLGALAKEVARIAEQDLPVLQDLTVGDHKLRMVDTGDGVQFTVPAVIDGHLVWLAGSDLDKKAAKLLASDGRFTGDAGPCAFAGHLRLAPLLQAITKQAAEQVDAMGAPVDVAKLLDQLGINALDDLSMQLGADGAHLVGEVSVGLRDGERGILAAFLPQGGPPRLLRCVPPAAETFSVTAFRLGALFDTVGKVWSSLDDEVPLSWSDAQQAFAEQMKVRLKEDLIDHVGGELLMIQDVEAAMAEAAEADEDDPLVGLSGSCIGLHLRDGKAFGESLEKLLRARGLHASRKTEDYQGTPVYRLRPAGLFDLEYAVTDDLLLLAPGKGDSGRRSLRAVLDARKHPAADGELPAAVKPAMASMPAGWQGLSATAMASFVTGVASGMEIAMAQAPVEVPEEMTALLDLLRRTGPELKRLGLQTMVSATWATPRRLTAMFRW